MSFNAKVCVSGEKSAFFKAKVLTIAALFIGLNGAFTANAQAGFWGIDEAVSARDSLIKDLAQGKFDSVARLAVNQMVYSGATMLRERGYGYEADSLVEEWQKNAYHLLGMRGRTRALGDHQPLSRWLGDMYMKLEDRLGTLIKAIPLLDDINTMNYALPVVFNPNGKWRSNPERDWVEYRKHFIPFANVTTYWVSYGACYLVTSKYAPFLTEVCDPGAGYLRKEMGRHWAPWLSDKIFSKYGKVPGLTRSIEPARATAEQIIEELNLGGYYAN